MRDLGRALPLLLSVCWPAEAWSQATELTPATRLPPGPSTLEGPGLANCGFVETTWSDKKWVLATSDHILRKSTCESLEGCAPDSWFDRINGPSCHGQTRYFKFEQGKKGAAAFTMAALGVGTFDGVYVKKGPFALYAGSSSSTPVAELKGPYFLSLQVWADITSCSAFESNTLIVPGGAGALSSYSLVMGKLDVASINIFRAKAGKKKFTKVKPKTVVFATDTVQIRIKLKSKIDSLEVLPCPGALEIRSFGSALEEPVWAEVPIGVDDELLKNGKEVRVTLTPEELTQLGIVSVAADAASEFASSDSAKKPKGGSNTNDSDAFDANVIGLASTQRGPARGPMGKAKVEPPVFAATSEFVSSGGVKRMEVRLGGVISTPVAVQDQADWFYFSGHGNSQTAKLSSAGGKVGPADVRWSADVDVAILAGCAVLDINDYNDHYPPKKTKNPGLAWAATGPSRLLGYNWIAPLDHNLGDPQYSAKIVQGYLSRLKSGSTHAQAWSEANKAMAAAKPSDNVPGQRPYNCCMIDLSPGGLDDDLYWYFDQLSDPVTAMWVSKPRSEW
jgi:hypothetical protein